MLDKDKNNIRYHVLKGEGSDIRDLLLNKRQLELFHSIPATGMTASALSLKMNVSIQNASAKLKRLYVAGYVIRYDAGDATGGVEYVYERKPAL